MDIKLRQAQEDILGIFSSKAKTFALAGGTALEIYYLKHRFSADLDFFSPKYALGEIEGLISDFRKQGHKKIKLESEFVTRDDKAKVRFYTVPISGCKRPLKIDFVEDVIFKNPNIKKINGLRVYSVENIYLMKLYTVTGTNLEVDDIGRPMPTGRREARDVFDIYMLSKKIKPLNVFLQSTPAQLQRGIIHWYRNFSRQDCKLALLDLDIYDKKFDSKEMIIYLDKEIEKFMEKIIE